MVLFAWGANGSHFDRDKEVIDLIPRIGNCRVHIKSIPKLTEEELIFLRKHEADKKQAFAILNR